MPPKCKGMYNMVKFRSNGWRNASVWGLFDVLFLMAGISLGSVKMEKKLCGYALPQGQFSLFYSGSAVELSRYHGGVH